MVVRVIKGIINGAKYCLGLLLCALAFSAHAVEVIDFLGRKVSLDKPAQRVIALAPHIVENVYSAGAGDQLIGVVSYSNFPEAAQSLPIVGGYKSFSLETILALKPDLVLMWASGNGMKALAQLESLNLPVYVDELSELEQIAKTIRDIGVLTGHADEANQTASTFIEELEQLRKQYANAQPVSTFYQVWNEPLQTLNGEHIINDAIELCGGSNLFANEIVLAPKVSLEAIIVGDPEAIVASGMGTARPEWLDEWLSWPNLKAVRNKHLFFIPPDVFQRHTARILLGTQQLCRQLQTVRDAKGLQETQ